MNGSMLTTLAPLALLLIAMYLLLIRPQKKKEKQTNEMRRSVRSGDQIITIGGICGKVVKAREESLIIQVGADRVKFEVMRWAISKVVDSPERYEVEVEEEAEEDPKAALPKRLKKTSNEKEK